MHFYATEQYWTNPSIFLADRQVEGEPRRGGENHRIAGQRQSVPEQSELRQQSGSGDSRPLTPSTRAVEVKSTQLFLSTAKLL